MTDEITGAGTGSRAVDDLLAEFVRLTDIYAATDRRNGTNQHDFSRQARQASGAVVRAREKGKLAWRHVLAERYWAVLAETGNTELRRQLVSLAAHALLWAAALDRRLATRAASPKSGDA